MATSHAFGIERNWRKLLLRFVKAAIGIVCVAGAVIAADLASSSRVRVNMSRAPNSAIADPWTAPLPLRGAMQSWADVA